MPASQIRIEDIVELTPMQHGLLLHGLSASGDGAYVLQAQIPLRGRIDTGCLAQACRDLLAAHPALRASFHWQGLDAPVQVIHRDVELPLIETAWPDLEQEDEQIAAHLLDDRRRGFDVTVAPLVRIELMRSGPERARFIWSCHHLVMDGWSLFLVLPELWRRYEALARGAAPVALPAPRPYRDYLAWLRHRDLSADEPFWRLALQGVTAPTPLPGGAIATAAESAARQPRCRMRTWSSAATMRLQAAAHRQRVTVGTLVHAAWALVLSRHSGQRDVLFGTVSSGRPASLDGFERMVGLFANTLALRVRVPDASSVGDWLREVQSVLVSAREHEHCPLHSVHQWSDVPRDAPLFESLVVFENYPAAPPPVSPEQRRRFEPAAPASAYGPIAETAAATLTTGPLRVFQTGHYPLCLSAQCAPDLCLELHYDGARFEPSAAEDLLRQCERALEAIADADDAAPRAVGAIELIAGAERALAATGWSDDDAPAREPQAPDALLHEAIAAQASRTPDAIALEVAGSQVSYGALYARARRLARRLCAAGVGPEVRVGLCAGRSIELVVGILAILEAGGAYTPLDPDSPTERLAAVIDAARPAVLLTQTALRARLPDSAAQVLCLDADAVPDAGVADAAHDADRDAVHHPVHHATHDAADDAARDATYAAIHDAAREATAHDAARDATAGLGGPATAVQTRDVTMPDRLAYVVHTSGSTGTPKGILLSHRSLTNAIAGSVRALALDTRDRLFGVFAPTFDGMMWQVAAALTAGARLVMPAVVPGGAELRQQLDAGAITAIVLPVSLLAGLPASELPALRLIGTVGDVCPRERVNQWAPGRRFINCYGPAEAAISATFADCAPGDGPVPIGRPIAHCPMFVVDAAGQLAPSGLAGELWIGGVGVARGYVGRPALTAERFVPDPWSAAAGARAYRTGDMARRDADGVMTFVGRRDHQVKVRGFRVELREVEAAVAAHPGVREAVAAVAGSGAGARLVAYVVPRTDAAPTTSALRAHVATRLPAYMVPAVFVLLPRLPLTPHGKVDRAALPAPPGSRPALAGGYIAPRSEPERILSEIWAQVLRVSPVGIGDNFFDLGGDSILAIQIVARAHEAGITLRTQQLFAHQTIAELIALSAAQPPIVAEQGLVDGPVPLTPIQHWFFAQQMVEPARFSQAQWIAAAEPIAPAVLASALAAVVRQHDALRLRFARTPDGWTQQHAAPPASVPLELRDLQAFSSAGQEAVRASTAAALQARLDLSSGLLVQAALCRGGTRAPAEILLVIHHLAVDVVSWPILIADLERACRQLSAGAELSLPPKTTAFQTWATRLQSYARARAMPAEGAYWAAVDARARAVPPLPVDHDTGPNTVAAMRTVTVSLEPEATQALLHGAAHERRAGVLDRLLAAIAQAMSAWTGSRATCVTIEGHGREPLFADLDLSRTVGWFTSMHPVVIELPAAGGAPGADDRSADGRTNANTNDSRADDSGVEDAEAAAALRAVSGQLRQVPHHGIGYGIWRHLAGAPSPNAAAAAAAGPAPAPRADITFNYLGQVALTPGAQRLLTIVPGPLGGERHPAQTRPGLLEITAVIHAGRLIMTWAYSTNRHTEATISAVAAHSLRALRALIALRADDRLDPPSAAGISDVPLSDAELDLLLNAGDERTIVAG